MNLVVQQRQLPQGLGFKIFGVSITLGGVAKNLVKVVGKVVAEAAKRFIPLYGDEIASAINTAFSKAGNGIEDLLDGGGFSYRTGSSGELSSFDNQRLTDFFNGEFKVFLQNMVAEVGVASRLTDPQAKIAALNTVMNKISAVQEYYMNYATGRADIDIYIEQRNAIINVGLEGVYNAIKAVVNGMPESVSTFTTAFNAGSYNYLPLTITAAMPMVSTENFAVAARNTTGTTTTNPTTTAPTPTSPTPLKPIKGGGDILILPNQPSVPVATGGNETLPAQAKTALGNPVVKIGAGIVIALVIGKVLFGGKKKKN